MSTGSRGMCLFTLGKNRFPVSKKKSFQSFFGLQIALAKQYFDELSVNESETYWVSDSKIHTPSHAIQKKEAQRSAMFVSSLKEASF